MCSIEIGIHRKYIGFAEWCKHCWHNGKNKRLRDFLVRTHISTGAHESDTEVGPVLLNLFSRDTIRQSHANFAHFSHISAIVLSLPDSKRKYMFFPFFNADRHTINSEWYSRRHASYAFIQITQN